MLVKNFLRKYVNLNMTDADVGIEVEVEGERVSPHHSDYWKSEIDHSLRGDSNCEYVLRSPISIDRVEESLMDLQAHLNDCGVKPSIRTGVHVHVNVQNLSMIELANFITLYLVVEDLLLDVCGEGRQSNLFCLKACEADYYIQNVSKFFNMQRLEYLNDDIRYSSLNLVSLTKFGSVEFRAMRTPDNVLDLKPWVDTLYHLRELSKQYAKPDDVLELFSGEDHKDFVRRLLPHYAEQLIVDSNFESKIKKGMRCAQDLAYSVNWDKWDIEDEPEPPKPEEETLEELIERIRKVKPDVPLETIVKYAKLMKGQL